MIILTGNPSVTFNTSPIAKSKWAYLHAPVPVAWTFQRQDYTVTSVVDDGSGRILINTSGTIPDLVEGDVLYLRSLPYDQAVTVETMAGSQITCKESYQGSNGVFGFFNSDKDKRGHYLRVQIYAATTQPSLAVRRIGTDLVKSDPRGVIVFDAAPWIRLVASVEDGWDRAAHQYRDPSLGGAYAITFAEGWYDVPTSAPLEAVQSPISVGNLGYWVNACAQMGERWGVNAANLVPVPSDPFPEDKRAEFLTDFISPTYFHGYPWDVGFVWSDNIQTNDLVQWSETGTGSDSLALTNPQEPGVFRIKPMTNAPAFDSTTEFMRIWLETAGTSPALRYDADGYENDLYIETF